MKKVGLGFTLIELMIVMGIISLLVGFVGPLAMNNLDRAQAKQELLTINNWLSKISARAFSTGSRHTLYLNGKQLKLIKGNESVNKVISIVKLEYLFFQPQVLVFNKRGLADLSSLNVNFRGLPLTINLKFSQSDNTSYEGRLR